MSDQPTIYVYLSADGSAKWSYEPFDEGTAHTRTPDPAVLAMLLDWFSGQPRLSLAHYSPTYGDDDDQSSEWRVTEESGSINDREFTVVGRGETALDAIRAALAKLGDKEQRA